jgi:queuine/archaeosine tRNA-ribosyltransferase
VQILFATPTGKRRDFIYEKYGNKFGAMQTRDVFGSPDKHNIWAFDNGAFADFKSGSSFNIKKYDKRIRQIEELINSGEITSPLFAAIPDIVAGGNESLLRSLHFYNTCIKDNALTRNEKSNYKILSWYLVVQDGMTIESISYALDRMKKVKGIFVGGSKPWKYENSVDIIKLAKSRKLKTHIGGIGSASKILWAKHIGADSVDSGVAMIHPSHLERVLNIHSRPEWNQKMVA